MKTDERSKTVMNFLDTIAANNDRTWFKANRSVYDEAREAFDSMTSEMISRLAEFDPSVANLSVKDCTYRIYRDIRFSNDKSPYKTHMGAYINSMGKKSLHGGYYFHLERGNCMVATGNYYLPSPILKAVRQSIVDDVDEFKKIVENPDFVKLSLTVGLEKVKSAPKGFPKDFPYIDFLRPKDYCIYHSETDSFFLSADWAKKTAERFRIMKPLMDFVNFTIDDYI